MFVFFVCVYKCVQYTERAQSCQVILYKESTEALSERGAIRLPPSPRLTDHIFELLVLYAVILEERQFGEICVSDDDAPDALAPELELPTGAAEEGALLRPAVVEVRLADASGDIPLATPKLLYAAAILKK
ncbi:unnamed protein product [Gongylonema pulchrum]|uniref:Uncharacterized protein n=1 Tax=Gongylonema pulchrum TaxID=637853 RepID=A0A183EHW2_9BILA|nr:unnamed protein product [Gongylonema pulchrum]